MQGETVHLCDCAQQDYQLCGFSELISRTYLPILHEEHERDDGFCVERCCGILLLCPTQVAVAVAIAVAVLVLVVVVIVVLALGFILVVVPVVVLVVVLLVVVVVVVWFSYFLEQFFPFMKDV